MGESSGTPPKAIPTARGRHHPPKFKMLAPTKTREGFALDQEHGTARGADLREAWHPHLIW